MKTLFDSFFDILSDKLDEDSFPFSNDKVFENDKKVRLEDYKQGGKCKGSESKKKYEHLKGTLIPISEKQDTVTVINAECWRCVIKEIREDGIRVIATDRQNKYSSRILTIKRDYFEELTSERYEDLEIDQQLDWVFKRVKLPKGQEIKREEFNIYKKLRLPKWQLQQQVEEEMRKLSFLFPDL